MLAQFLRQNGHSAALSADERGYLYRFAVCLFDGLAQQQLCHKGSGKTVPCADGVRHFHFGCSDIGLLALGEDIRTDGTACEDQHIKRQKYNSIVNKTPILPETNRAIGGDAPSIYKARILKKVNGLTEEKLRERIESHLVDYDALVSDDFDNYFVDRAKKLLDLIENAMGKKVADRNAENTIEQFGESLA